MCGRFLLDADFDSIIYYYGYLINNGTNVTFPKGDVFPSQTFPVITKDKRLLPLKWGINIKGLNKSLINARSESLFTKPVYKNMNSCRCLIIANSFYEWDDKTKVKYKISGESPFITLGGLYSNSSFLIITKEANSYMKGIHKRMPLILNKDEEASFLSDDNLAKEITYRQVTEKVFLEPASNQQISLF
ncbi:MAG: SOS response-associated peptidase family protein [Clostridiaceae bacterium]